MAVPSVYHYDYRDDKHSLYLGEFSTSDGLNLVGSDSRVRIRGMYAESNTRDSEMRIGQHTVEAIRRFLETVPSIVDFDCLIGDKIVLTTHDDGECHFQFDDETTCEKTLRRAVNPVVADTLWRALVASPGKYVTMNTEGTLTFYSTFDDYINAQDGG